MRLGIDFGTTRTVVAIEDRGNYPLVSFADGRGSWMEWYPSHIAARDGRFFFGPDAQLLEGQPDTWHVTSFKRLLAHTAPDATIDVPSVGEVGLIDLLCRYLASLREALTGDATNVSIAPEQPLETMISVPANANSNQRFVTIEAFRMAGFSVVGMMNEPSAAGVEYAHRHLKRPDAPRVKQHIAVYDLGGGTFDAAAIRIAGMRHDVVSSEGVEHLGGDDFDRLLFEMVCEARGDRMPDDPIVCARLLAECRERKESLNPNTRKILIDADSEETVIQVTDYYDRCTPLVDRTIDSLETVLARLPEDDERDGQGLPASVATVYLVGGSVNFPLVARVLRDRYGRKVQRSPYPHGAVAIGLAVAANPDEKYFVRETLTRHFGVWREADSGARVSFDPIFVKDVAIENGHALAARRRYHPAHNIGRFRFVECASLSVDGHPTSDVTPWSEIVFPFHPGLQGDNHIEAVAIERCALPADVAIVEEYTCDATGIVSVMLREESTGYERTFRLAGPGQD